MLAHWEPSAAHAPHHACRHIATETSFVWLVHQATKDPQMALYITKLLKQRSCEQIAQQAGCEPTSAEDVRSESAVLDMLLHQDSAEEPLNEMGESDQFALLTKLLSAEPEAQAADDAKPAPKEGALLKQLMNTTSVEESTKKRVERKADASSQKLPLPAVTTATTTKRPPSQTFTAVLRRIPKHSTRETVLSLINGKGFAGHFDYFYMPLDFKSKQHSSFAFINFKSVTRCAEFLRAFPESAPAHLQGFEDNLYDFMKRARCRNPNFFPIIFTNASPAGQPLNQQVINEYLAEHGRLPTKILAQC